MNETLHQISAHPPTLVSASCNRRRPGLSPTYHVHHKWSFNLYECSGNILLPDSGRQIPFFEGSCCVFPPQTKRQFHNTQPGKQWVVHFQPCNTIIGGEPIVLNGAHHLSHIRFLCEEILINSDKERQQSVTWHLLWLLAEKCTSPLNEGQQHFNRAMKFIKANLDQPITVNDIVDNALCSHNQLTRIFNKHLGKTIVATLRNERMQRAQQLLAETNLPIAVIGQDVGLRDPHLFNKTVRKHFGFPPSELRRRHQPN